MCERRVCIVTGAARGIGRAHAEALAEQGAHVVVNDIDDNVLDDTVDALTVAGGEAIGYAADASTPAGADGLIHAALETWGRLDVVVNNAGITRDKMLVNMAEADWDAVLRVHLKSTFLVTQFAARQWRERSKAGDVVDARVINTVSSVGLYGNVGQSNYGAAKAAIASLTIIAAMELSRYRVTVNALCPTALTQMTASTGLADSEDARDGALDPKWVSPALVWLASQLSSDVTGRVIITSGKRLAIAEGWHRGPTAPPVADATQIDAVIRPLLAAAAPNADTQGAIPAPA